jgi:putative addiction module CopG family antidote
MMKIVIWFEREESEMTIQLPEELERFIRDEVLAGRYSSEAALVTEAIRLLKTNQPHASETQTASPVSNQTQLRKPIWEIAEALSIQIPANEAASLPTDGAAEHDHYIHGTPKRSAS